MQMTEEDIKMLNGSIQIIQRMYGRLRNLKIKDAKVGFNQLPEDLRKKYTRKDGKDTRLFDIVAEEAISLGDDFFGHDSLFKKAYNQTGVVITEERGKIGCDKIEHNTPVIISDPVDRSSYLEDIINKYNKKCKTMGEIFDAEREKIGDAHARVEACTSSVTLLKDNMIKYSVILNLFTGEVFVAYEPGVFHANINKINEEKDLKKKAEFKTDETLSTLFYTAKGKYENNRNGTHLRFFNLDKSIKKPGGPIRFTYLLKEKEPVSSIGVIAHNGEKIQESLPNIAVAYFSNGQLQAYKLFCDRKYHEHRAGKGLTPNLENSIYNNGKIIDMGLKLAFLNNHSYPSEFRDTTIIVPSENEAAITYMVGMVKRDFAIQII